MVGKSLTMFSPRAISPKQRCAPAWGNCSTVRVSQGPGYSLDASAHVAVEYLHHMGIVHRDLKLENLLRKDDGSVAITDFGFATSLSPATETGQLLQTACGSPCYAAPELVLDKKVLVCLALTLDD